MVNLKHENKGEQMTATTLQPVTDRTAILEALEAHLGQRVGLTCQLGVCIWNEMFTLESGHGLCQFDCVRDGMRIGIGLHTISRVKANLDCTLSITVS